VVGEKLSGDEASGGRTGHCKASCPSCPGLAQASARNPERQHSQ